MMKVPLRNVQTACDFSPSAARRGFPIALKVFVSVLLVSLRLTTFMASASAESKIDQDEKAHVEDAKAVKAGRKLFLRNCARCHGHDAEGTPSVPALAGDATQSVPANVIFSYITRGDVGNGMPSWARLPQHQRWQIVTYLKSLSSSSKVN